ncbi:alpha-N-arabinofuranosidase [Sodiomyces alkalinus F11]|uniref:non-reducing end alpha-L-arabinofuranosidase n=1 Tax=Sodiomyces alkalinus (strain CBS 110278 / VKM F-3762 / F11) TaxID=1314773 RepID=A0A3N2PQ21_SODAK|nr:alpha-N-arabinofuranosidase [Sodiomyces alkalinus F11]ROT36466.1 alpha-N-arabinofuranosidase [Sodiomyces alkalinus F11]
MFTSWRDVVRATTTALVVGLAILAGPRSAAASPSPAVSYTNTLIHQRADPHIVKHTDGWYYFTATVPEYDRIILRRAETIQGLSGAEEVVVWDRDASGTGVGYVWAPELHHIDGKWYVHFALGIRDAFDIRPFVIEGTGANPLTADWVEKGVVRTNWETFSLDATTFVANGTRYLCWAQNDPTTGDSGTSLLLAPMENPWTLRLPAVVISRPEYPWERVGHNVNEGAYVVERNGRLYMPYSAAATDHNYAVGMLSADADADLMDPASWEKASEPLFVSNALTGQWGPGHHTFTVSEDGLSDLIVYHARNYSRVVGEPLNNPDRHTRVQKVYWGADGTPDFGIPVPDGPTPFRFRSHNDETLYTRHGADGGGPVSLHLAADRPVRETQFRVVSPGFAGEGTVSLEAASHPGEFLRDKNGIVELAPQGDQDTTPASASFVQVEGLADGEGVSFALANDRARYIRSRADRLLVVAPVNGAGEAASLATFYTE